MKTILINTIDKYGSTGSIAHAFFEFLKIKNHQPIFLYGRGKKSADTGKVKVQNSIDLFMHTLLSRVTGKQGYFSHRSTKRIISIISDFKPDVVYLMNIHGYYLNFVMLFDYLKSNNYPTVYIMFDEYAMTGKCCFTLSCDQFKTECNACPQVKEYPKSFLLDRSNKIFNDKIDIYRNFENLVFVSVPFTISKARTSGLLKNRILIEQDEGIDLIKTFYPRTDTKLREKLNIAHDSIVFLNVAPFSNLRKGAKYYLEAAKIFENNEKYVFIHVGFDVDIKICPSNFIPISYVADFNELAEYYTITDLFIVTSFAETTPNTAMQALACGTPICGFDIEGIPYTAPGPFGTYVEPGNVNQLVQVITNTPKKNETVINNCRNYAKSRYSDIDYYESLIKIGLDIIK